MSCKIAYEYAHFLPACSHDKGVVGTKTNRVFTLNCGLNGLVIRLGILQLSSCLDGALEEADVVVVC